MEARNHSWVVNEREKKELVGVITEHDVLSTLAPKDFPSYVFGMPDIRSIQHGTAKTAGDVMANKVITCEPDEKIVDALMKMVKYKLRRLPVLKDKEITCERGINPRVGIDAPRIILEALDYLLISGYIIKNFVPELDQNVSLKKLNNEWSCPC